MLNEQYSQHHRHVNANHKAESENEDGNSDNSAESRGTNLSIGNNSFGFNFDSDEMIKIGDVMTESSCDGFGPQPPVTAVSGTSTRKRKASSSSNSMLQSKPPQDQSTVSSLTSSLGTNTRANVTPSCSSFGGSERLKSQSIDSGV